MPLTTPRPGASACYAAAMQVPTMRRKCGPRPGSAGPFRGCDAVQWWLAVTVRAAMLLLVSGLPQLTLAVEDGVGPTQEEEIRQVRRLLFFDRAHASSFAVGASALTAGAATPWSLDRGVRASGASGWRRGHAQGAAAMAGTAPPGPSKRTATILRVIARHQSSYV